MSRTRIIAVAVALALAAAAATAVPASAKGGRDVRVRGACTQSSTAKLELKREDAGVEVEFEVDQNRNGVRWTVKLRRNGAPVASTRATTRPPSGSFTVRRVVRAGAAAHITAVATRASGERCTAQASV